MGLKIEGEVAGKKYDIGPEDDESKVNKKQTFLSYTRTTTGEQLNYVNSNEVGTSKLFSLTELRVLATTISLG